VFFSTIDWSVAARRARRNTDVASQLFITAADVKEPQGWWHTGRIFWLNKCHTDVIQIWGGGLWCCHFSIGLIVSPDRLAYSVINLLSSNVKSQKGALCTCHAYYSLTDLSIGADAV
jgi:hypothetical protein